MFPSDFVGLSNIFSESELYLDDGIATHVIKSSKHLPLLFMKIILSIIVLFLFIQYVNKNKNKNIIFVIALGIFSTFIINLYLNQYHDGVKNYLYNKISSTFILYLSAVFFVFLLQKKRLLTVILLYSVLVYSSYSYVKDSYRYCAIIEPDLMAQFQQKPELKQYIYLPNERGYRNGEVVGKLRYIDRTDEFMLRGLIGIYTLDQWNLVDRCNMPNHEIILLTKKAYIKNNPQLENRGKILFETKNYIALHTGVLVDEIPADNEAYPLLQKLFIQ